MHVLLILFLLTLDAKMATCSLNNKIYPIYRYISQPYLINGLKFDLRLYVYVPSFNPLRIYVFDDGLVRFASTK